jgi:hypothetical protein
MEPQGNGNNIEQMVQEIGKIVTDTNDMVRQIGQMLSKGKVSEPSGAEEPGNSPEPDSDEALRQEAIARLSRQR